MSGYTPVPFDIFSGLLHGVTGDILRDLPTRQFQPGDVLLAEGEVNERVYLIEAGELEVWKGKARTPQGVCVARLKAGNCFGEMSAINSMPSTATIIAATPASVRIMGLTDLPSQGEVRENVTLNLARTLVSRLSNANTSIQQKHERELNAMKIVASASAFLTRILTGLSMYMFSMPAIAYITPMLPSNSIVSFFFIAAFSWLVLDYMRERKEIRTQNFHMTLVNWPRQVARGLMWAGPLMLVMVAIKTYAVTAHPETYGFFEPMRALKRMDQPQWGLWGVFVLAYAILTFAQEFIRCAAQGTLDMINVPPTAHSHWKAILVSDVVFASLHMHLSPLFAVQAFIAGLYFGYEFYRERSYLSVAVTHAAVGVWSVFIVGVPS